MEREGRSRNGRAIGGSRKQSQLNYYRSPLLLMWVRDKTFNLALPCLIIVIKLYQVGARDEIRYISQFGDNLHKAVSFAARL